MKNKIINIFLLFSLFIHAFGQISNEKPHADRFFMSNGDTVWYSSIYTWKHSDVNWLRNSRTHLYALVDSNLNVLTNFEFGYHFAFDSGYNCTAVMRNGKWGVVNRKGEDVVDFKYILPPQFYLDTTLNKEFYIFTHKNKMGVIDSNGKTIVPFKWNEIIYLNYAIFELKNSRSHYLYFMKKGIKVPKKKYSEICSDFNRYGKAIILDSKTNKYGIMDTSCTIIQPCIYNNKEVRKFLE